MRLFILGLVLLLGAGCNQISGADDFTFEEETNSEVDGGDGADSEVQGDAGPEG